MMRRLPPPVDRYDKRKCSHTETTRFYSPGEVVFDVDGFRFGCALIEVNFTDLFGDYERRGVHSLLLSAYPVDSVFAVKARALRRDQQLLAEPLRARAVHASVLLQH